MKEENSHLQWKNCHNNREMQVQTESVSHPSYTSNNIFFPQVPQSLKEYFWLEWSDRTSGQATGEAENFPVETQFLSRK